MKTNNVILDDTGHIWYVIDEDLNGDTVVWTLKEGKSWFGKVESSDMRMLKNGELKQVPVGSIKEE